jgi:hypothetical protein
MRKPPTSWELLAFPAVAAPLSRLARVWDILSRFVQRLGSIGTDWTRQGCDMALAGPRVPRAWLVEVARAARITASAPLPNRPAAPARVGAWSATDRASWMHIVRLQSTRAESSMVGSNLGHAASLTPPSRMFNSPELVRVPPQIARTARAESRGHTGSTATSRRPSFRHQRQRARWIATLRATR